MKRDKVVELRKQVESFQDSLTEILRKGAKKLIADAVEAEFGAFMAKHGDCQEFCVKG